jgi:membrane protease YdiL (CAAX protease family)
LHIVPTVKSSGFALILFVTIYAPAFAMVAVLRPSAEIAIPLIIIVSAGLAAVIAASLAGGSKGIAEFGVAISPASYVFVATLTGTVVGAVFAYVAALHPVPPPLDVSKLRPQMIFVYFVLAAPLQEEFIFRGLLQSTIARAVSVPGDFWAAHFPVAFVAALFGVIHLESGILVAAGAVLLGLIAGELRRMSGSLVPAILVHALFNAVASLWPSR